MSSAESVLNTIKLEDIYALGNAWIQLGDELHERRVAANGHVEGIEWKGAAGDAARLAWSDAAAKNLDDAIETAWTIGQSINRYADKLHEAAEEYAKKLNAMMWADILGAIFSAVFFYLGPLLEGVLAMIGQLIARLIPVIASMVGRLGPIGSAVVGSIGGAVIGSASGLAFDLGIGAAGAAIAHTDYDIDWGAEALTLGIGGGFGGIAGGLGGYHGVPKGITPDGVPKAGSPPPHSPPVTKPGGSDGFAPIGGSGGKNTFTPPPAQTRQGGDHTVPLPGGPGKGEGAPPVTGGVSAKENPPTSSGPAGGRPGDVGMPPPARGEGSGTHTSTPTGAPVPLSGGPNPQGGSHPTPSDRPAGGDGSGTAPPPTPAPQSGKPHTVTAGETPGKPVPGAQGGGDRAGSDAPPRGEASRTGSATPNPPVRGEGPRTEAAPNPPVRDQGAGSVPPPAPESGKPHVAGGSETPGRPVPGGPGGDRAESQGPRGESAAPNPPVRDQGSRSTPVPHGEAPDQTPHAGTPARPGPERSEGTDAGGPVPHGDGGRRTETGGSVPPPVGERSEGPGSRVTDTGSRGSDGNQGTGRPPASGNPAEGVTGGVRPGPGTDHVVPPPAGRPGGDHATTGDPARQPAAPGGTPRGGEQQGAVPPGGGGRATDGPGTGDHAETPVPGQRPGSPDAADTPAPGQRPGTDEHPRTTPPGEEPGSTAPRPGGGHETHSAPPPAGGGRRQDGSGADGVDGSETTGKGGGGRTPMPREELKDWQKRFTDADASGDAQAQRRVEDAYDARMDELEGVKSKPSPDSPEGIVKTADAMEKYARDHGVTAPEAKQLADQYAKDSLSGDPGARQKAVDKYNETVGDARRDQQFKEWIGDRAGRGKGAGGGRGKMSNEELKDWQKRFAGAEDSGDKDAVTQAEHDYGKRLDELDEALRGPVPGSPDWIARRADGMERYARDQGVPGEDAKQLSDQWAKAAASGDPGARSKAGSDWNEAVTDARRDQWIDAWNKDRAKTGVGSGDRVRMTPGERKNWFDRFEEAESSGDKAALARIEHDLDARLDELGHSAYVPHDLDTSASAGPDVTSGPKTGGEVPDGVAKPGARPSGTRDGEHGSRDTRAGGGDGSRDTRAGGSDGSRDTRAGRGGGEDDHRDGRVGRDSDQDELGDGSWRFLGGDDSLVPEQPKNVQVATAYPEPSRRPDLWSAINDKGRGDLWDSINEHKGVDADGGPAPARETSPADTAPPARTSDDAAPVPGTKDGDDTAPVPVTKDGDTAAAPPVPEREAGGDRTEGGRPAPAVAEDTPAPAPQPGKGTETPQAPSGHQVYEGLLQDQGLLGEGQGVPRWNRHGVHEFSPEGNLRSETTSPQHERVARVTPQQWGEAMERFARGQGLSPREAAQWGQAYREARMDGGESAWSRVEDGVASRLLDREIEHGAAQRTPEQMGQGVRDHALDRGMSPEEAADWGKRAEDAWAPDGDRGAFHGKFEKRLEEIQAAKQQGEGKRENAPAPDGTRETTTTTRPPAPERDVPGDRTENTRPAPAAGEDAPAPVAEKDTPAPVPQPVKEPETSQAPAGHEVYEGLLQDQGLLGRGQGVPRWDRHEVHGRTGGANPLAGTAQHQRERVNEMTPQQWGKAMERFARGQGLSPREAAQWGQEYREARMDGGESAWSRVEDGVASRLLDREIEHGAAQRTPEQMGQGVRDHALDRGMSPEEAADWGKRAEDAWAPDGDRGAFHGKFEKRLEEIQAAKQQGEGKRENAQNPEVTGEKDAGTEEPGSVPRGEHESTDTPVTTTPPAPDRDAPGGRTENTRPEPAVAEDSPAPAPAGHQIYEGLLQDQGLLGRGQGVPHWDRHGVHELTGDGRPYAGSGDLQRERVARVTPQQWGEAMERFARGRGLSPREAAQWGQAYREARMDGGESAWSRVEDGVASRLLDREIDQRVAQRTPEQWGQGVRDIGRDSGMSPEEAADWAKRAEAAWSPGGDRGAFHGKFQERVQEIQGATRAAPSDHATNSGPVRDEPGTGGHASPKPAPEEGKTTPDTVEPTSEVGKPVGELVEPTPVTGRPVPGALKPIPGDSGQIPALVEQTPDPVEQPPTTATPTPAQSSRGTRSVPPASEEVRFAPLAPGQASLDDAEPLGPVINARPRGAAGQTPPEIITDWVRQSGSSRRSEPLQAVDLAVRALVNGWGGEQEATHRTRVLQAITAWKDSKSGRSARDKAIARLGQAVVDRGKALTAAAPATRRSLRDMGRPSPRPLVPVPPHQQEAEGYGPARGFEVEVHLMRVRLPRGESHQTYDQIVNVPGLLDITLDKAGGQPVLEIVSAPTRSLVHGAPDGRAEPEAVANAFLDSLHRITHAAGSTRFPGIFPASHGYVVDDDAAELWLQENPSAHILVHHTVAVPLSGFVPLIRHVRDRMRPAAGETLGAAHADSDRAIAYGERGGERFARWIDAHPTQRAQVTAFDAPDLVGVLTLGFAQVVAALRGSAAGADYPKDWTAATSRDSLSAVRAGLGPVPRAFLEDQADVLAQDFVAAVPFDGDPLEQRLRDVGRGQSATVGEYLDNLLLEHPDRVVDQYEALVVRSNFDALDSNPDEDGRPRIVPSVVRVEVRSYAPVDSRDVDVLTQSDALAEVSLTTYNEARVRRGLPPVGPAVRPAPPAPVLDRPAPATATPAAPVTVPRPAPARPRPAVPAPGAGLPPALGALAAELPRLPAAERAARVAALSPGERAALVADPGLVREMRETLTGEEFRQLAAEWFVVVPVGVHEPADSRAEAERIVGEMTADPDIAEALLTGGRQLLVVPRDVPFSGLEAFHGLQGAPGRSLGTERGGFARGYAGVPEENLLGEPAAVHGAGTYADGYSSARHEWAHAVESVLDPADQQWIKDVYEAKRAAEAAGETVPWPDGRFPNYSSSDAHEYFAQLTTAYHAANAGVDELSGSRRNNGADWVEQHDPALLPLLHRLYGPGRPAARDGLDNPLVLTGFRAFWGRVEGTADTSSTPLAEQPAAASREDGAADVRRDGAPGQAGQGTPGERTAPGTGGQRLAPPAGEGTATRPAFDPRLVGVLRRAFGPGIEQTGQFSGLYGALHMLVGAYGATPRFSGVPFDLDTVTRHVLRTDPAEDITPQRRMELFQTISSAARAGWAGGLPGLVAYRVRRMGALGPASVLTDASGNFLGRNLTGHAGLTLDAGQVLSPGADGNLRSAPAPWPGKPHVVVAEREEDTGRVRVAVNGGGTVSLDEEEFAALVAQDPDRSPEAPVAVGVGPRQGGTSESLSRLIADGTATRAWGVTRPFRLQPAPGGARVFAFPPPEPDEQPVPVGSWFPSDPGLVPAGPEGRVTASDGSTYPDSDVRSYPIVTSDGQELTGRSYLDEADIARREEALRMVSEMTHYYNETEAIPGLSTARRGPLMLLPRGLADAYVTLGHGEGGRVVLPMHSTGRNHQVAPTELGRELRRRPSVQRLRPEVPLWLLWCEIAMARPGSDPLVRPVAAQEVSNQTRRHVVASDALVALDEGDEQHPAGLIKTDDPDRPRYEWHQFLPEPLVDRLIALADHAGLPGDVARRTTRVLRWVRALRLAFGFDIDTRADRQEEFLALISDFGALEQQRLWQGGAEGAEPLTWRDLEDLTQAHAQQSGHTAGPVTAGTLHGMLSGAGNGTLRLPAPRESDAVRQAPPAPGGATPGPSSRVLLAPPTPTPTAPAPGRQAAPGRSRVAELVGRYEEMARAFDDHERRGTLPGQEQETPSPASLDEHRAPAPAEEVRAPVPVPAEEVRAPVAEVPVSPDAYLEEHGLTPVHILPGGDTLAHLLTAAAPVETGRLSRGERPATPGELRERFASALATEFAVPPAERTLGLPAEGPRPGTPLLPAGEPDALVQGVRTGQGPGASDWLTLAVAAPVLNLRLSVLLPDGRTWTAGPREGRAAVLLHQENPPPHTSPWLATEPADTAAQEPARTVAAMPPVRTAAAPPPGRTAPEVFFGVETRPVREDPRPAETVPTPPPARTTLPEPRTEAVPPVETGTTTETVVDDETTTVVPPVEDETTTVAPLVATETVPAFSPYIQTYGARHDGSVGFVAYEVPSDEVLHGLREQVMAALGVETGSPHEEAVRAHLDRVLDSTEIAGNLPAFRGPRGHRVTVPVGGVERTVDVRLRLTGPGPDARTGVSRSLPRTRRLERQSEGIQALTSAQNSGTARTVSLPYLALPEAASGPLRWVSVTVAPSLTLRQRSLNIGVSESLSVKILQRAGDDARSVRFDGAWQVRADAEPAAADGWDTEQVHGPLHVWFPGNRVGAEGDAAELPRAAGLDTFPLWGVEDILDAGLLTRQVLDHEDLPAQRDLGAESRAALEDFLDEQLTRGSLHLQRDRGVMSPLLTDTDGTVIGFVRVRAVVTPGTPYHRTADGDKALEVRFTHSSSTDRSARVVSGAGLGVAIAPMFTSRTEQGHPGAADHWGGRFQFKGAPSWQSGDALNTGAKSGMMHGLTTSNGQLLTPADLTYEVTFVRAGGGTQGPVRIGRGEESVQLRLLPHDIVAGAAPTEERRGLPPHLDSLSAIGYTAVPLSLEGADEVFDRAEARLRALHYLPPLEHQPWESRIQGRRARAQLANLQRFEQLRSGIGQATALPDGVEGGRPIWLDLPGLTGGSARVELRMTITRDRTPRAGETGPPAATHELRLADVETVATGSHEARGTRERSTALGLDLSIGGGPRQPAGNWSVDYLADGTYARTWARSATAGSAVASEQANTSKSGGTEIFAVPARLALDLYQGTSQVPEARFAEPPAPPRPAADTAPRPVTAAGTDTVPEVPDLGDVPPGTGIFPLRDLAPGTETAPPTDTEPGTEDTDPEAGIVPARGEAQPVTAPVVVRLAVSHHRTLPRPADAAPAEVPEAPGYTIRAPRTGTGADNDRTLLGLVDEEGNPLPDVTKLLDDSHADLFRAAEAIQAALRLVASGDYPGRPDRGTFGQLSEWARQAAALPGVRPVSDHLVGQDPRDRGTFANEAAFQQTRVASLLGRAHQILNGVYTVEGIVLPGLGADQHLAMDVEGYLHHPTRDAEFATHGQNDVNATDLAAERRTKSSSTTGAFGVTGLRGAPRPTPEGTVARMVRGNIAGTGSRTHRGEHVEDTSSSSATVRGGTEGAAQHLITADLTLLLTIRHGTANVVGNAVGLGSGSDITLAIDVPRAVQFRLYPGQLIREARWFSGIEGLVVPTAPPYTVSLPDDFVRTREPGFGAVLSVTQLDDPVTRRPSRNRMWHEVTRLVERVASGVTRPGNIAHLSGVAALVADQTSPTRLRTLPTRGSVSLWFRYGARADAHLVEVTLRADPEAQTPGLREIQGRPAGEKTGVEQQSTHAPDNRMESDTVSRTVTGLLDLGLRDPRPGTSRYTDRWSLLPSAVQGRALTRRSDRTADDRFWQRSDNVADFDRVGYRFTVSVRTSLIPESLFDLVGGLLGRGLASMADRGDRYWLPAFLSGFFHGAPAQEVVVPVDVALRFAGSDSVARTDTGHTADGVREWTPLSPRVRESDPLLPAADEETTPAGERTLSAYPRFVPTSTTPLSHFNAFPELAEAIRAVSPGIEGHWGLTADAHPDAGNARLTDLAQSGRPAALTGPATAAGLHPRMPGGWPVLSGTGSPVTLQVTVHDPRLFAPGAADIAADGARTRTRVAVSTATNSRGLELGQRFALSATPRNDHLTGAGQPLLSAQPATRGSDSSVTTGSQNRVKNGTTSAGDTYTYLAHADVVVTVTGPEGVRYVTGSATVRAGERDLLGYGVVTAPSVPWAYDLPSVVRERRAADDRARHAAPDEGMAPAPARTPADPGAWRTEPVTELPALLASGIAPEQEAVQFWLDLGADPDASALAHALYVGTRVAAISHRRVELAVRGTTGLRFWPIEADGSLADVTPATSGGWEQLRRAVDAYTRAVDREAAAVAAQQPLDARLPDLRQQVAEADGNRRQRQLRMEEAEALHTAAHDTHTALVAEWNTRREELEQAGRDRTERKNEVTAAERDLAAADEVVRAATRAVVPAPDGTPAPESAAHALQRAEARQRDAVRALGAREEGERTARREVDRLTTEVGGLDHALANAKRVMDDNRQERDRARGRHRDAVARYETRDGERAQVEERLEALRGDQQAHAQQARDAWASMPGPAGRLSADRCAERTGGSGFPLTSRPRGR
ncbi:hypothetical protein OG322_04740 [Streptomyces sp. NBC_01260]|uniref:hypothetical protein n=1 Tax=Streptomyces sp. NBC_01260 TaxID=2903801 RepID=UPI002E2ED06E|nr:hypothetical protein [Streptomyces sp. NBC_01260]